MLLVQTDAAPVAPPQRSSHAVARRVQRRQASTTSSRMSAAHCHESRRHAAQEVSMNHAVAPGVVSAAEAVLDAEKLDAYHVALEFQALVGRFLRRAASLRDQLDRASV